MPQSAHAWLQDEDRSGAATGLAAVADDLIITSGDNLRLRKELPLIAMAYLWTEFTAYPVVIGTVTSPPIANNPHILTHGVALNYLNESQIYDFRDAPIFWAKPGDNMSVEAYEADEAGVAHFLGLVIITSDGAIPFGPRPQIDLIHRCTVGAASAAAWSQLALTEINALPAGKYKMWGARVEGATTVAARFVFKGVEIRPAVIPVTRSVDQLHSFSRFWGAGIDFTMPDGLPDLEILDTTTTTAGDVELYLTREGEA